MLGVIRKGRDIGKKPGVGNFIWAACKYCGKERWVQSREGKPIHDRCHHCYLIKDRACLSRRYNVGVNNSNWKGGRRQDHGYIQIKLQPDDFFYPMASKSGYVFEHRLVIAKHIGRNLQRWELVHHKNHIRNDNRRENLQLVSDDRHKQITAMENKLRQLEAENAKLRQQNQLLREQLVLRR